MSKLKIDFNSRMTSTVIDGTSVSSRGETAGLCQISTCGYFERFDGRGFTGKRIHSGEYQWSE